MQNDKHLKLLCNMCMRNSGILGQDQQLLSPALTAYHQPVLYDFQNNKEFLILSFTTGSLRYDLLLLQ